MRSDNSKGNATAFATLSPFNSWFHYLWEGLVLGGAKLSRDPEPTMHDRAFLHHAYWLRLQPKHLDATRSAPRGRRGALLFLSSFTGNLPDYLRGFTAALPREMDSIWARCTDWPGAANNRACVDFIAQYRQRAEMFFNAFESAGVTDVRQALRLRDKLDEFATEFAQATDAEFVRAFQSLVTSHWSEWDSLPEELS